MRCCARLHYCASVSASLSQRRRLPGCILESAASVRCSLAPMRQVSLPPRLPLPPPQPCWGLERRGTDARRGAHTWSVEKEEVHSTGEEKERRLSCLSSPLTLTHQHAPDQPPQSAIQAEHTSFPHYCLLLPSSNCICDGPAVGKAKCSHTFRGGLFYCKATEI